MGSFIEINDTLQIDYNQGFPLDLNINDYIKGKIKFEDIENKIFNFEGKPKIRIYKIPPVRNFLVQNIGGKWIYWGLIHVLEIKHDYINQKTSGKYKIIYLNTLEEMKVAHNIIDRNNETNYFQQ